jgi:4-hydroxyphenylacetate 3-monooxygenase
MFYAGATFVTRGHSFRCYDWAASNALLDGFLGSYSLEQELASRTGAGHGHR